LNIQNGNEFSLLDIVITGAGGEQTRDMLVLRIIKKDKNANSF
jgi:hypothetical protein